MNRLVTIILFIIGSTLIWGQNPPAVEWSKTFNGTGMDWGYSAIQTSDGGYALTSRIDNGSLNFDARLIKTNSAGEIQWSKSYGSTYIDETYQIKQLADGGYVLCGVSTQFGNAGEAWVIRTNSSGEMIWNNGYHSAQSGSSSWDYFYDIIENSDGSFTAIGYSYVDAMDWQGWIAKISSSGTLLWSKVYGDQYWERLFCIKPLSDGGYIAVGDKHVDHNDTTSHDGWLVRFNSVGDTLWTKLWGGAQIDIFRSVEVTSDGNFIISGEREPVWALGFKGWMVKTDANGNLIFNNTLTAGGLMSITECSGGYVAAGIMSTPATAGQGWMIKTDASGNVLWNKYIDETPLDEVINSLCKTSDGGYILGGRSNSNGSTGSGWLVKIAPDGPAAVTTFLENFDGVTTPALPQGWTGLVKALLSNTVAEVKTFIHGAPPSAPNAIFLMNGIDGSNGQIDANAFVALVSPLVIVPADGGDFSFYALGGNSIKVGTMTDPTDTTTFTLIQEIPLTYDFVQHVVHVSSAGNKYLVLKHSNTSAVTPLFIDNVSFVPTTPVELVSFTAASNGNSVILNWITSTETNNDRFEIQRSSSDNNFITIAVVNGNGTTTEFHKYTYTDVNIAAGKYTYRIKQVDYNGSFSYSGIETVTLASPENYILAQNYPNPFNPMTMISYQLSNEGLVTLKVYDLLGNEIKTLVNEYQQRGEYQVSFDATSLSSGVYIYQIQVNDFISSRKMTLIR